LEFYQTFPPLEVDTTAVKLAVQTLKSIPDPKVFLIPGAVASEKR
jgi:hypothetical protein